MQQYMIQPGDSLYFIAQQYKIPLAQLVRANPEIENPNIIFEGQVITIPDLLPIPSQFDTIDSTVASIIDDIYAKDWENARNKVNIIKTNMNEVIPSLQQALVPNQIITGMNLAINDLGQNIMQEKVFQSVVYANRVRQYIPDILDYFQIIVPTDVGRLEYLGRQIILNVEGNNWSEANKNYLRAKTVWDRLKPELDPKYSNDITNFDQVLSSLLESINQQNYQSTILNASNMLDLVDILEADFRQINTAHSRFI